ncbi:vasodilator-stimulated phosphoprotein-like isoform X1 [Zonotrichia leucophrys gambelii]|uniref:vasodilator-stimulated phosphoprotein-like isoform X1 n=1 Tax=Zonotrichia leucophrys gambelii TaxID=257770 RepID=UPI00313FEC07
MVPQTANAAEPPPVPPGATPCPFWAPEPGGSCCAPGARQEPCLPKHNRLLGEPSALAAGAQQPRRPHRAAPASPAVPEPGLGAGPGCPSADPLPAVYTRWRAIGNDRGSLGDQAQTALARAGLTAGSIAQPEEGESTRRKGGTAPLVRRAFQKWKKDVKPSCKTRIPPAAQNSLKPLLCGAPEFGLEARHPDPCASQQSGDSDLWLCRTDTTAFSPSHSPAAPGHLETCANTEEQVYTSMVPK